MTLEEAKVLLNTNKIPFSELTFNNVIEFRKHISPFANLKNAADCSVKVLVVLSNNKHKNIELQFIDENSDGNYIFVDLYFGQYFYELFDCQNNILQQSIIDEINSIISNDISIIAANNLTKKTWFSIQIFDKKENDGFGILGYEKAIKRINEKKRFFSKLFGRKMQYEIYDWNTYQCIIK